jgi:hypothetical protein
MKMRPRLLIVTMLGAAFFFGAGFFAGQGWVARSPEERGGGKRTVATKFQADLSSGSENRNPGKDSKLRSAAETVKTMEEKMQAQVSRVEVARLEMMEFMKEHKIVDLSVFDQSPSTIEARKRYASETTTTLDALRGLEGKVLVETYMRHTVSASSVTKLYPEYMAEAAQLKRMEQEGYEADSPDVVVLKESMQSKFQAMEKAATEYRKTLEERLAELRNNNQHRVSTKEEQEIQRGYARLKQNYEAQLNLLNVMREHRMRAQVDVGVTPKTGP